MRLYLDRAGLPTLELSRKRAILMDVYKNLLHASPAFMWNSYTPKLTKYNLRNTNTLCVPQSNTTRYGLQTLTACGAKLWNSLPNNIKSVFEIALVRLSETSDYLHGQVNNPSAVNRWTSESYSQIALYSADFRSNAFEVDTNRPHKE